MRILFDGPVSRAVEKQITRKMVNESLKQGKNTHKMQPDVNYSRQKLQDFYILFNKLEDSRPPAKNVPLGENIFCPHSVNFSAMASPPAGSGFEQRFHTCPMGLLAGNFSPNAFDLFLHLRDIFVEFLDGDRIEVPFGFRHVFRQIVVFQHLLFSSYRGCQCDVEAIDLQP